MPRCRVAVVLSLVFVAAACRRDAPADSRQKTPVFPPHPDVVLITIDTLRADALGFAGNSRVETPILDRLAGQGLDFSNAHAHNVVTLPSHVNILTGLYPYQHGVRDNTGFHVAPETATLATWLKHAGYRTGAFVGAFPLDSRFGLSRGFDVYDDRYPKGKTPLDFEMPERPASEVIAAAERWYFQNAGGPRFLWVHLYDCHAPYRPPEPFASRYKSDPYLGEVAGVDAALASLLDPILSGKAPPTLIVVTADHGEARGDHGEETHGLFAYEATLHVPLIVWMPGVLASGRISDPARHVDIAPTILAAAGVAKPASLPGLSLFGARGVSGAVLSYFESYSTAYNRGWAPLRGMIGNGYKFVDLPLPELYDLKTDSAESHNLFDSRHDEARRLRAALSPESAFDINSRTASSSEEIARLRSLGYLSGSARRAGFSAEDDPKNLVAVDQQIHASIDRYQRGDLAGAVGIARKIVAERPTMAVAYENLGFLLRQTSNAAEALSAYRQAIDRRIAPEELYTAYALALCESGRAAEAVRLLAPFSDSREPDTLNAYGVALADSGKAAEAIALFERVLSIDPENVGTYADIGIVRLRSGDLPAARDAFQKALAIDGRFPRAWNGLGVALARGGNEREAIDCWAKAVDLDPRLYDALFNLGLTAGKNGLRQQSRRALEKFVATAPPALYRQDIARARGLLRNLGDSPS